MSIQTCPVPQEALLQRYVGQGATYTDCFYVEMPHAVTFDAFVTAFYTSRLFRFERNVLRIVLRSSSTDADARALALGKIDKFSAWVVEARAKDQLLLCDLGGHTRSWFAVQSDAGATKLMFGSAVVIQNERLPLLVRLTLPMHVIYSKLLLRYALRNLLRTRAY